VTLLQGQAVHEVTLRLTLSADTIPAEWDWVTLLDLGGDEDVTVSKWEITNGYRKTDDKVYTQAEVDDIIGPETWPKAIIRSMTRDEPIRSEDVLGEHIWTDLYGYLPVKEFTGAVRVQPQPELPEDMVTVLMADGRTLAVHSIDLYYED